MKKSYEELEAENKCLTEALEMLAEALHSAHTGYMNELSAREEYERTAGALRNVRPNR